MVWYRPSTWGESPGQAVERTTRDLDLTTERRLLLDSGAYPRWSDVSAGRALIVGASEERALALVPVFAAVALISDTISTLPLKTYRDLGDVRQRAPQAQLFLQLERAGQLTPWLHQCLTSLLLRGNAYGEIVQRDGYEFPTQIEWLNPDGLVYDASDLNRRGWRVGNRLIPERNVVHVPWFTLPGRREGLSPIGRFRMTIEAGHQAAAYGHEWFNNGGFPPGTFKNTQQTVPQDEADVIKVRLARAITSRQPLVYGSDWEYSAVTVPPSEAQFIEAQRLNATQIAGIYRVPPEMIGGETGRSMTYQNVEQQQINFVQMTLRPWLVLLERAFSSLLPERQYVRFNADAIIRADTLTRHQVYEISRRIGLRSLDELRGLEELEPLPNGGGADYLTPPAVVETPGPDNVRPIGRQRPA